MGSAILIESGTVSWINWSKLIRRWRPAFLPIRRKKFQCAYEKTGGIWLRIYEINIINVKAKLTIFLDNAYCVHSENLNLDVSFKKQNKTLYKKIQFCKKHTDNYFTFASLSYLNWKVYLNLLLGV